ncbi:acyl-CoA-like ligand-binding transcription factor [Streptomyces longispororuber]|uniref:acyl-CoA-like ligand-binding transcription factor n=1 Tax=Streptomyces longispororuber TaxID=68230 RepID=UPI00210A73F0|nr:hypothetical protein [Streptomyces longispororuber]MCQ4207554.1 hypothetical protein [Streptomyces longispororuber]
MTRLDYWSLDTPLLDFLERSYPDGRFAEVDVASALNLVRLTLREPGLRTVWLHMHEDSQPVIAQHLAHRVRTNPDDLAVPVKPQ